jgi:hypothetical protein
MLLLSAVQLVCAIRAHAALLKVLYVVEPRLDLVAYSSSNATVWCGRIIKSDGIGTPSPAAGRNRFAAGGAECV